MNLIKYRNQSVKRNFGFLLFLSLLMGSFLLQSCSQKIPVASDTKLAYKGYTLQADKKPNTDAAIEQMIKPYRMQVDSKMNQVIGQSARVLSKDKPESLLGNWVADLILKKSEAYYEAPIDLAIVNYGGLRIPSIPQGDITTGKIFELMPFDNMMVVITVNGGVVRQLFELILNNGGWPISHTVRIEASGNQLTKAMINGALLQDDKMYKIALSDFVANGGDKCFFFKGIPQENLDILMRDMMIEFVKEQNAAGQLLDAKIEGRIIIPGEQ